MLGAFSVTPLGGDASVGELVAGCVRIVRDSGLESTTGPMFTTVEGEPDEVFALLSRCLTYVEQHAPRVSMVVKIDHRPGHEGQLTGKVARIERVLADGGDPAPA